MEQQTRKFDGYQITHYYGPYAGQIISFCKTEENVSKDSINYCEGYENFSLDNWFWWINKLDQSSIIKESVFKTFEKNKNVNVERYRNSNVWNHCKFQKMDIYPNELVDYCLGSVYNIQELFDYFKISPQDLHQYVKNCWILICEKVKEIKL
jgi:hypothetical protein